MVFAICLAITGLIFLFTGTLKAIDAGSFLSQIGKYGLIPRKLEFPGAVAFIGIECALGAALVLSASPLLVPLAASMLMLFASLTLWAARKGRIEDCGCYGGQLLLTPAQSVGLDVVYLALLAIAWFWRPPLSTVVPVWKIIMIVAVLLAALVAAAGSVRTPLADLSLLRAGRLWRGNRLTRPERDLSSGSHFVVFLSRDCSYCKNWVPLLNVIEVQPDFPSVMGVMSLEREQLEGFQSEHMIRFPIVYMPQSRVSLMVKAYPTATLVENGVIRQKWTGEMPKEYVERIQQFLEAVAAPGKRAAIFGG